MADFSISSEGVSIPGLADARRRAEAIWRSRFGAGADVSVGSPDGDLVDILAVLLTLAWQGAAAVLAGAHLRTAEGAAVDRVLDLFARRRLQAAASVASVVFYGASDGTPIAAGSLVEAGSGGPRFATDAAAELGESVWVARVAAVTNGGDYTITVDGVANTYTADGSATRDEIVAGVIALLDADGIPALDGGDDTDGRGLIVLDLGEDLTVTAADGLAVFRGARVAATATETGAIAMLAGDALLVAAITGITGACTTADAELGRDRETDAEFKSRHLRTLSINGARTYAALEAGLLELDGVTDAIVRENDTTATVGDLPAHCFAPLVLGGDEDEIVAEILRHKPGGIRSYGTTEVEVELSNGRALVIGYTRPTERFLHLEITIGEGEGWPSVGDPRETIRLAVAAFLAGTGRPRMGADFYRVALYGTITTAVAGVATIAIRTSTTAAADDPPTYSSADVTVEEDEILRVDSSRIEVI